MSAVETIPPARVPMVVENAIAILLDRGPAGVVLVAVTDGPELERAAIVLRLVAGAGKVGRDAELNPAAAGSTGPAATK